MLSVHSDQEQGKPMGSLLRSLSVAFIVSGVSFGTYALLKSEDGEQLTAEAMKLRPAINEFVDQGHVALSTLLETSREETTVAVGANGRPKNGAQLPFIVIGPQELAAPAMPLPSVQAPVAAKDLTPELRLTQAPDQAPVDLSPVEARMRARVSPELFEYFDLFLYVSKATPDKGAWAQRMFVLAKQDRHIFQQIHNWPVSTGMEETVLSPSGKRLGTHTPEGVFKLDRGRFYEDYTSRQWKSPMPYAMFFDWRTQGRVSGLAIHGSDANGEKELGNRASHGCIRLATANARTLFELITTKYKGKVPVFRVDPDTGTMSTKGLLVRDDKGRVKMTNGYKALVFIEDYGGPTVDTVAALY